MVTTERKGHPTIQITKVGCIDVESIEKSIGGLVKEDNPYVPTSISLSWHGQKASH